MPVELRPLGVGEIFDRAVTLYVQNFAPFAIIAAFVAVPTSILRYFYARSQQGYWTGLLDALQHKRSQAPIPPGNAMTAFYGLLGLELLLSAFMYVAVAVVVWRLYEGKIPDWRAAYRASLHRAGAVIATVLAQILAFFCGIVAATSALVLLTFICMLLLRSFVPLGIAAAIFTILCAVAFVCMLLLLALCFGFTFEAIVIENARFMQAAISAYERVFNRRELWKALLVCIALAAIQVAFTIAGAFFATLAEALMHAPLLEAAFQGVLSLIAGGFVGVLLAVYYFDVRIRAEGLDMQADLDRLELQPQA